MITVTSVSGGQTSAFIAANYPSDHLVFSLVRIEDPKCKFPDKKLRQEVEDRIQKPFVGTAEDDVIIHTLLDLEQYIGQRIDWVSGDTFDQVVKNRGGWIPNKLHRYCTTYMKLEPIFYWWAEKIGVPFEMRLGFRANEMSRAKRTLEKCNSNGLLEHKATFEKHPSGRNKWEMVEWQRPTFPLIDDGVFKDEIVKYWEGKPVRFAPMNNCVGCFHRNPILIRKMFDHHPNKMQWFADQEGGKNGYWKHASMPYKKIKEHKIQHELAFDDFSSCDTGYCGL